MEKLESNLRGGIDIIDVTGCGSEMNEESPLVNGQGSFRENSGK